jgi:hydroxymethylpyrimidine pyrophosphatase-like HAD family hydrolase
MTNKKKIKKQAKTVLGCDIDDTITKPNEPEFANQTTLAIVQELHKMGHYVVPVTGRSLSYAERLFDSNKIESKRCDSGKWRCL